MNPAAVLPADADADRTAPRDAQRPKPVLTANPKQAVSATAFSKRRSLAEAMVKRAQSIDADDADDAPIQRLVGGGGKDVRTAAATVAATSSSSSSSSSVSTSTSILSSASTTSSSTVTNRSRSGSGGSPRSPLDGVEVSMTADVEEATAQQHAQALNTFFKKPDLGGKGGPHKRAMGTTMTQTVSHPQPVVAKDKKPTRLSGGAVMKRGGSIKGKGKGMHKTVEHDETMRLASGAKMHKQTSVEHENEGSHYHHHNPAFRSPKLPASDSPSGAGAGGSRLRV